VGKKLGNPVSAGPDLYHHRDIAGRPVIANYGEHECA
jgi:hypothetical protein